MANTLITTSSSNLLSRIMGLKRYKMTVFRSLASFQEEAALTYGQVVNRPYRSNIRGQNYTAGTALTAQDLTLTDDQLTVNKRKAAFIYVDSVDKIASRWDLAKAFGDEMGKRLAILMDGEFLYEAKNAGNSVDDGDLGGTDGSPLTLTVDNVDKVFAVFNRKLDAQNADMEMQKRFMVISPQFRQILWERIAGKESMLGDKTAEFGSLGRYAGVELYLSNNLTASARWTPANDPSNTDTITISGVTFTFVTSIGSTAGNVLTGGGTSVTLDNLVDLINNPTSTTANHVAFTGANLDTVSNMVAVDGTTYVDVYHKGQSFLTVATSDAADPWSLATQHVLGGVKGAIDMVIQQEPSLEMSAATSNGLSGQYVLALEVFGTKTFNQGANEIVDVQLASANFS